jgi:exodeoxyribonuclease VIII
MEDKNLGHLMLDLETMGNNYGSVICSIGAVEFDLASGDIGRKFYEKVSIQSCLDLGLRVTGSTIEWWLAQSEEARKELYDKNGKNITEVLYLFRTFLELLGTENLQVWGNGVRFDLSILESAYRASRKENPWKYVLERDVRTLVSFAPDIKNNWMRTGIHHNPIDDCINQIGYCSAIYNKLKI